MTQTTEPRAPTVVSIPGYRLTIQPITGRVTTQPRPSAGQVHAIRCVGCCHLTGIDLPSRGRLLTCRLGHWNDPRARSAWLGPSRLLSPPPGVRRAAEACADHAPQEGA